MTKYLLAFALAWGALIAVYLAPAVAQVPACVNDTATVVPCPTATAVPPTATPQPTSTPVPPTPLPAVPPQVRIYQKDSCGTPVMLGDFYAGNGYYRVFVTRNGVVMPPGFLDLFGTVPQFFTDSVSAPGFVYKAFAFPRETAPFVAPGQIYDGPTVYPPVVAAGVAPCAVPTLAVAPVPVQQPVAPTPTLSQAVSTVVAANAPTVGVIRPPSTGSAGLLP